MKSLDILCQKQEIAKMSANSHLFFLEYLEVLRAEGVLQPVVSKRKEPKNFKLASDNRIRNMQPRMILELDTFGENLDSDMLREQSIVKDSSLVNISEDFKEEEIQEQSDLN